ncbi:MAG: nucleoside hydrolase [Anaerolineae bacterium]|nr:nucleoside hydrolase [Anaerolineae bacterium]
MAHKVLFDGDNTLGIPFKEIDDGLALLYLLGHPDIELLGITTIFGNGPVDTVYPATKRLLHSVNRIEIPLLKGAERRGHQSMMAARFLAETVAHYPGEVSLVTTGPLTNIWAASELDVDFFSNLKQIVSMGGVRGPLRIGWRNLPELNFSADPVASWHVLRACCPVTVMNAHVCLDASFGWDDLPRLSFWDRHLRRIIRNWLLAFGLYCGVPRFYLWDLLPVVYITHPSVFFDTRKVRLTSTLTDLESGLLTFTSPGPRYVINMPSQILDIEAFKHTLFETWSHIIPVGSIGVS